MEIKLNNTCFLCNVKTIVLNPCSSQRYIDTLFNTFFEDGDRLREEMKDITRNRQLCLKCADDAVTSSDFKIEYEDKCKSEELSTLPKCLFCRTPIRLIDAESLPSEFKEQVELFMTSSSLPEFESANNICLCCHCKLQLWSETRTKIVTFVHSSCSIDQNDDAEAVDVQAVGVQDPKSNNEQETEEVASNNSILTDDLDSPDISEDCEKHLNLSKSKKSIEADKASPKRARRLSVMLENDQNNISSNKSSQRFAADDVFDCSTIENDSNSDKSEKSREEKVPTKRPRRSSVMVENDQNNVSSNENSSTVDGDDLFDVSTVENYSSSDTSDQSTEKEVSTRRLRDQLVVLEIDLKLGSSRKSSESFQTTIDEEKVTTRRPRRPSVMLESVQKDISSSKRSRRTTIDEHSNSGSNVVEGTTKKPRRRSSIIIENGQKVNSSSKSFQTSIDEEKVSTRRPRRPSVMLESVKKDISSNRRSRRTTIDEDSNSGSDVMEILENVSCNKSTKSTPNRKSKRLSLTPDQKVNSSRSATTSNTTVDSPSPNFKKFKKQLFKKSVNPNRSTPRKRSKDVTHEYLNTTLKHLSSVKKLDAIGLLRVDVKLLKDKKFAQIPYVFLKKPKSNDNDVSFTINDSDEENLTTTSLTCNICDKNFETKLDSQIHKLWHEKPEKLFIHVIRHDLEKLKREYNSQKEVENIACKYLNVSRLTNKADESAEVLIDTFESNSESSFVSAEETVIESLLEQLSTNIVGDDKTQSCENQVNVSLESDYSNSKENDINENNKKRRLGILLNSSNRSDTPTPKKVRFSEP